MKSTQLWTHPRVSIAQNDFLRNPYFSCLASIFLKYFLQIFLAYSFIFIFSDFEIQSAVTTNQLEILKDEPKGELYLKENSSSTRSVGEATLDVTRARNNSIKTLELKNMLGDIFDILYPSATMSDFKDFIQQQDTDLDTKASEEQAFVIQNPETGKQTVVINRGVAAKEAIRHEVGHVLLYQTVKDSPETAINLGNALLNELNKIDPAQVKDSNFKKRMEQYADSTRAVQMEEAVTLFSDAINTGDITPLASSYSAIQSTRPAISR